jgi:hypothetical protein
MKAIVVELRNNHAAVLSDDGCVIKIKNNHFEIGQEIQFTPTVISTTRKAAMFVASAAACLLLSVGTWAYASPYSYVSVDVNPSLEFSVNRFDRVLDVKAVNDDGQDILNSIPIDKLRNKSITDAISQSVNQIAEAGYFDGDTEGGIVIATSSKDEGKADDLAEELKQTVEQENQKNHDKVVVETFSVAKERVKEAKSLGVTPGKLNLVEKLQKASGDASSIDTKEWLTKSVKDIMKATKNYRKSEVKQDDASDENATLTPVPSVTPQIKKEHDKKDSDGKQNINSRDSKDESDSSKSVTEKPKKPLQNSDQDNNNKSDKYNNQNSASDNNDKTDNNKTSNNSEKSDNNKTSLEDTSSSDYDSQSLDKPSNDTSADNDVPVVTQAPKVKDNLQKNINQDNTTEDLTDKNGNSDNNSKNENKGQNKNQ